MVEKLFIILTIVPIFSSIVALVALITGSFEEKNENKNREIAPQFIRRDSRTIKVTRRYQNEDEKSQGLNTQVSSLLWTVIIGQAVGLYFLLVFLKDAPGNIYILRFNGLFLLCASFLCSVLTIMNGWLKKKMNMLYRLLFQGYSFILALVLIFLTIYRTIAIKKTVINVGFMPYIIIFYFLTVIVTIGLMLIDGISKKQQFIDFNYNVYYLLVILIGMVIGLGLWGVLNSIMRS